MFKNPFFFHILFQKYQKGWIQTRDDIYSTSWTLTRVLHRLFFKIINCLIPLGNPFVLPSPGGEGGILISIKPGFNLCLLGNFACFFCHQIPINFNENSFMITIRESNRLDPDKA